jgi:hypothetical protein
MTQLFNNSSAPFYRFGNLFFLEKIKSEKWVTFIEDKFAETRKTIPHQLAQKIPELMKNHSWYVQQFSYFVWSETTNMVSEKIFETALNRLIQSNTPLFQQLIEELSTGQINLIKAIVEQEKQLSSKVNIAQYNLGTSANVTKNKEVLLGKDLIHKTEKGYELLDPVFEIWFLQTFLNKKVNI